MVRYQYVGKIGPYTGKRIFEILTNLKNNGEGRLVQRLSELKRNKNGKEQFYKIVKAAPQMDQDLAFGEVWAQQIKDSKQIPFLVKLKTTMPDYQLILKVDESKYLAKEYPIYGQTDEDKMNLKRNYKVPPVLAEFLNKHHSKEDLCLLKHGLNKAKDGYDNESVINFKIPYIYTFDEYQELCEKVYDE